MIQAHVCKADSDSALKSRPKALLCFWLALIVLIWPMLTALSRIVPGHSDAAVRAILVWYEGGNPAVIQLQSEQWVSLLFQKRKSYHKRLHGPFHSDVSLWVATAPVESCCMWLKAVRKHTRLKNTGSPKTLKTSKRLRFLFTSLWTLVCLL